MTGAPAAPPGRSFRIVLANTFAAFCAFYAPQPLLPFFAAEFQASPARVALLLSVCFVALAIAPLVYGAALQRFSAQRLLTIATLSLALLQFAFAAGQTLNHLLAARCAQALLFPAIFTAAVTYCSRASDASAIARRVSTYVACTILGGLAGRLVGGMLSDAVGWRTTFVVLGLQLLLCAAALTRTDRDQKLPRSTSSWSASLAILSTPTFAAGYTLIFLTFFVFSGLLNALPFRLVEIDPTMPSSTISLVYLGYLVGVVIALNIARIGALLGGAARAMLMALMLFVAGLALGLLPSVAILIAAGFLTSAGMFTVHATLSGALNASRPERSSLVNGLYIAIYYSAGALGSLLPLALYQHTDWYVLTASLGVVCVLATWPLLAWQRSQGHDRATG